MLWTCTYRYRRITQNGSPWRTCNQFILDVSSMHRNSDSSGCGFRGADYSSSSPSRDFRAANNISQMLAKKMWVFQNLGLNNIGVSEQKKENLSSRKVSDIQNQPLQQSPLWSRRCQWLARSPENWPQFSSFFGGKLKSLSTGTDRCIYIYICGSRISIQMYMQNTEMQSWWSVYLWVVCVCFYCYYEVRSNLHFPSG